MPVEKKCDSKKHDRQIPIGQKFSPNKSSNVYLKTTPPRSGLTWKPTGRIFTQVGLKWIPIRKPVETRYNMNDSASPLGKKTHNPNTTICANSSSLSAGTSMASEPISSKGSSNVNILSTSSLTFRVILFSIHMMNGNPSRVNLKQLYGRSYALSWKPYQGDSLNLPDHMYNIYTVKRSSRNRRYKRRCCSLIPTESNSIPHVYAQTTKTYYKHQDSSIKKAQVLKTKTFANSDIKDPSSETKLQGRLLASFQDDAKYEHGLDAPTRQILNSRGAIPSMKAADAKKAIHDMADYSQKWHTMKCLLGRRVMRLLMGPYYIKDCLDKEDGKTLEEAYYTQFGVRFPQGQFKAAALGYYQRNNGNPLYQERRQSLEYSMSKFMTESARRHEENSNLIKEIHAATDSAIIN
ncbi:hypothetical protein Tco_0970183 [Tanacetum coccineum]